MGHENKSSLANKLAKLAVATTVAVSTTMMAAPARAETVAPDGKGIAGGALLGAEIVTMPMALFNVQSGAAYAIGGGLGAVGGGVGGYFIEQNVDDGRVPVYMLAGGLALVIPTVVLILNATSYKPVEGAREDRAPSGPPADPGSIGGSVVIGAPAASPPPAPATGTPPASTPASGSTPSPSPAPGTTPTAPSGGGGTQAPISLIDFGASSVRMGIPLPQVRPVHTMKERRDLGTVGGTELRFPLVGGRF